MWKPFSGMQVMIDGIGPGKIVKVMGKSALVAIDRLNGLQIEKNLDDLVPAEKHLSDSNPTEETADNSIVLRKHSNVSAQVEKPPKDPISIQKSDFDKKKLRKIPIGKEQCLHKKASENSAIRTIESLRFGLVPDKHIEELTLGFEELKQWIENGFDKCKKGVPVGFEISGIYGTGKSHTLSMIRYLAEKEGFLTASVEVDGKNLSFSDPEVLLNNLWGYLSGDNLDYEFPLLDLYIKVIEKGGTHTKIVTDGHNKIRNNLITINNVLRSGHLDKYSEHINTIISSGNEYTTTQVIKEITSEHNLNKSQIKLKRMIDRKVENRPMCFVESIAGHAIIAKLAGYKGLIITIDEFEIEHTDKERFEKVQNILKALHKYLTGDTKYYASPLGIYIATIDQGGHSGDRVIQKHIALEEQNRYRLGTWDSRDRTNLAQKIHKLYCEAYALDKDFDINLAKNSENILAGRIENNDSGLIRNFIKWYVGLLDIKYGPPKGVKQ